MLSTSRRFQIIGLVLAFTFYANCVPQKCFSVKTHHPCIFPFSYQGATYHNCTRAGNSKQPWCATSVNKKTRKVLHMEDCDPRTCNFEGANETQIIVEPPVVGCKEDNVKYPGSDVGNVTRQLSWELCKIKCRETKDCKHWTFRKKDGACWLKTALQRRSHADGFISGPKNCNVPSRSCKFGAGCTYGLKCQFGKCLEMTSPAYSCTFGDGECYGGAVCQFGKCVARSSPEYSCSISNKCPGAAKCRFGKCEASVFGR